MVETADGAPLHRQILVVREGLRCRVDATASSKAGGYIVDLKLDVTSGDGRIHRIPDLPPRRATSWTRGSGWGGMLGCSIRSSPGAAPPLVVAPGRPARYEIPLRPDTEPTYKTGARMRVGVGLFDVKGPDGRITQPAIATVELVVRGPGSARLGLRPGVDADLKRRCWRSPALAPRPNDKAPVGGGAARCRPGMPGWPCANAACTLCCCEDGVDLHIPRAVCCPKLDKDGDGLGDQQDQCPTTPEDKDGFEDADGCPDPDNDGDGILDVDDLCPNDPEDIDGHEDKDGCPDR